MHLGMRLQTGALGCARRRIKGGHRIGRYVLNELWEGDAYGRDKSARHGEQTRGSADPDRRSQGNS